LHQVVAGTLFLAPELRHLSGLRDVSAKQLVLRQERESDVFECVHGVLLHFGKNRSRDHLSGLFQLCD
jgi:hypothetical protein